MRLDMTDQFGITKRRLMAAATPVETGMAAEVHRAFRLAMSRSLADVAGVMVTMGKSGQKRSGPEHVTGLLADMSLIGLLTSDEGTVAFVALDTNLVKAIVHMQTLGHLPKPVQKNVAATLGEAALVSPVIDHLFGLVQVDVPENAIRYRFKKRMACAKTLLLDTGDLAFDVHEFSVVLDQGTTTRCLIATPYIPASDLKSSAVEKSDKQMSYQMELPVELHAIIKNATRVWGDVADWTVGHELVLGPETLFNVAVQSASGRTEFHAQLGRADGNRALRLYLDEADEPPINAPEPHKIKVATPADPPKYAVDEDLTDLDLEELDI